MNLKDYTGVIATALLLAAAVPAKADSNHIEVEQQRDEIKQIFAEVRPELNDLRDRRRSNREALNSMNADDIVSGKYPVALERLTSERSELVSETDEMRERLRAEVAAVLSAAETTTVASPATLELAAEDIELAFSPAVVAAD